MTAQIFEFDGPRGYRLSGKLDLPTSEPQGWAIFAHCFTCGKASLAASRLARALAARGIGVLRFDFAGVGSSGGSFATATFAADGGSGCRRCGNGS
jgi:putative redox protein